MHNRIVYLLVIITLIISSASVLSQQEEEKTSGEVLTLEQAITLALRDNHLVKNAELGVGKAGD